MSGWAEIHVDLDKYEIFAMRAWKSIFFSVFLFGHTLYMLNNKLIAFFLYFAHEFAELLVIFISEVLGTTVLLFMGCLGGVNWGNNMPAFVPGLLFGLTVAMLIQCLGAVSGAHMNPAVTLAAVLMKQLKPMVSVLSQNKCLLSEQMTRTATVKLNFDFHFCF